jgi:hypothetical protein
MTKRKVLAVATLAALPVFVAVSQSPPELGATRAETAHTWSQTDRDVGPQWVYALGMEGEEALGAAIAGAIGCAFFGPVGGAACGITGAL